MISSQDPDFADLDAHIRAQLTGAAESYAGSADIEAKLKRALQDGPEDDQDDPAAANSSN